MEMVTGKAEHITKSVNKVNKILTENPDYIEGFYYSMLNSSRTESYKTREEYIRNVVRFLSNTDKDVTEIKMDDINKYLGKISTKPDGSSASGSYLVAIYSALKKFFEYMVASERINKNPMNGIDRPAPKKPELVKRTYLTPKEINKCFKVIEREGGMWEERNIALFIIFFCTGIRNTALTEINVSNVDFENNCIYIVDKGTKPKTCYLTPDKMQKIKKWVEVRENLLEGYPLTDALFFGKRRTRITQNGTADIIKRITTEIGHPISPHKARASFATNALNNGVALHDVSKLMGHTSTQVTSDCYIQGQDERLKEAGLEASSFIKI